MGLREESGVSLAFSMIVATSFVVVPLPSRAHAATAATTTLVSMRSDAMLGDASSLWPAISGDGRSVAFSSQASNLVTGDTNGAVDVFVHDRTSGETKRISVSSAGAQGDDISGIRPAVSNDGRYVAFSSQATNLVGSDTNGAVDVFVRDTQAGSTVRASVSSAGAQGDNTSDFGPAISADGRSVAFQSVATNLVSGDTNGHDDVFVRDLVAGTTSRVSVTSAGDQGDHDSVGPALSANGRYVAFSSLAANLVPGDTNGVVDVFVHDRVSGVTERVSVSSSGAQGDGGGDFFPSISNDGRYVAFMSRATNLVSGDTNGVADVFVRDRSSGTTTRVSLSSSGAQGDAGVVGGPAMSADGRSVAFVSNATNLASGDTNGRSDVFVRDLTAATTTRVSVSSSGGQQAGSGADFDFGPAISSSGRAIAFQSDASNLVAGDTNGVTDVFVRDLGDASTTTAPGAELFGLRASSAYASDPVNVATGNFVDQATDLAFPTTRGALSLTRTYNAQDPTVRVLGRGWSTNLATSLRTEADGAVRYVGPDGRVVTFVPQPSGGYARPAELHADLVANTDGTFALDSDDGRVEHFDTTGRLIVSTDPLAGDVTYAYDGAGKLATATHEGGDALTFAYDPTGRLVTASATDGRVVHYAYDAAGLLASVTDPTGGVTTYSHDGEGRITKVIDPDGVVEVENNYDSFDRVVLQTMPTGATARFGYDPDTLRTVVTYEPSGTVVTYAYDTNGRVGQILDPYGEALTKTYDATGNLTSVTDRRGEETTQVFDAHGNVTSRTTPGGAAESFTYDAADRLTSSTDPLGNTTHYAYEDDERLPSEVTDPTGATSHASVTDGLVTSVTDPDGVRETFTYDDAGRLLTSRDGAGNATTYAYDAMGNTARVTTPLGHATTSTYDALGRLTSSTDPTGAVTTNTYTPAGRLATSTDPTGAVTTYEYDEAGRRVRVTDPNGGVTRYAYDEESNVVEVTDPSGAVTKSTYDALGRTMSATDATGATTGFAYDEDGNPTASTDPAGGQTTTTYDSRGRVSQTRDATGAVTTNAYDTADRLVSVTDPLGAVSTYAYDAAGRQTSVTDPTGAVTRSSYTPAGRTATSTDANGAVTTYAYDDAGRQISVTDPLGNTTRLAYDADGQLISETSPSGEIARHAYDGAGRQVSMTDPAGGIWRTRYTPRGEVARETDPLGAVKAFTYDPAGNMIEAVDPNGATTLYAYDRAGRKVSMTDATGAASTYAYDAMGRLVTTSDPDGSVTTSSYDPTGRLATTTDATGRSETRTYDLAGRLTKRSYADGAEVTYTYDAAGRRTSMHDATGTTTYAYDVVGRLLRQESPRGALAYAYDEAGRKVSMTYPDGTQVTYAYDQAGRLTKLETPKGDVVYEYDADSRLVHEDLPQGMTRSYAYEHGRLARFTQRIGDDTKTTMLTYDQAGRRVGERRGGNRTAYTYDPAGQLTGASGGDQGVGNDTTLTYNEVGRRTTMREGNTTTTYSYDHGRLATASVRNRTTTYAYDEAGRRTAKAAGNETTAYAYDHAGRLASVATTMGGGARTQTRAYDGDGVLVGVGATDGDDGDGATSLVWDGTGDIPEIAVLRRGNIDTNLVYGAGRALALRGDDVEVFTYDASGSAVGAGAESPLACAHAYDAFGNPKDASGEGGVTFGYRGEAHVGNLVHLRARDYDPVTGTFTTKDPLEGVSGTPTVANPYHYADNDPANQTDPTGLRPTDADLRVPLMIPVAQAASVQSATGARLPSEKLLNFIKFFEITSWASIKERKKAQFGPYTDYSGKCTIGIGHLAPSWQIHGQLNCFSRDRIEFNRVAEYDLDHPRTAPPGTRISLSYLEAKNEERRDARAACRKVLTTISRPLSQCQLDALTSYAFKFGHLGPKTAAIINRGGLLWQVRAAAELQNVPGSDRGTRYRLAQEAELFMFCDYNPTSPDEAG